MGANGDATELIPGSVAPAVFDRSLIAVKAQDLATATTAAPKYLPQIVSGTTCLPMN